MAGGIGPHRKQILKLSSWNKNSSADTIYVKSQVLHVLASTQKILDTMDRGGARKLADRRSAVALGQLGLVGRENERHVAEERRLVTKRLVHEHLAQSVGQVLLGAQNVRDLHQRIVHGDAKVVDRQPVGAHDDKVAEGIRVEGHVAANQVRDRHLHTRHQLQSTFGSA